MGYKEELKPGFYSCLATFELGVNILQAAHAMAQHLRTFPLPVLTHIRMYTSSLMHTCSITCPDS
jgi:hypothetical protein